MIALNMIVNQEVDELDRCLSSVRPFVDGAFVTMTSTNTATMEVLKKHNVDFDINEACRKVASQDMVDWLTTFFGHEPVIKTGDSLFQFDMARNHALSRVPKDFDYCIWVDADDILRGGQNLKAVIDEMKRDHVTSMFMNYLYDVELDGQGNIRNILIQHQRERIWLNDGRYRWVAPIHETLIAQTGDVVQRATDKLDVVHLSSFEKKTGSIARNMRVLEVSIYESRGRDPRPIYYLAKGYYDHHTDEAYRKCEALILKYLQGESPSGWAEERAQAWEYLADIYRIRRELNNAMKCGMNALIETGKFPSTYLSLALTCLLRERYDEAIHWVTLAGKVPMPDTTLVINPRDMVSKALEVIYNASLKQNKLDEAWAAVVKLHEMFPQDEAIANQYHLLSEMKAQKDATKTFVDLAKYMIKTGDHEKLRALAFATPTTIESNPIIAQFIKDYRPPTIWPEKSVVIYCGPGHTPWNPSNLHDKGESFIGGSEEAVIYAAQELVRQGYKVTVYGDPGEEANYYGVTYLSYFKFNPKDTFDIFIGWRNVMLFDLPIVARKTYLWLHDVPNAIDFTPARLKNITRIMVLSQAHRQLLPDIPDDKFFITRNGFVEERPQVKATNNPKRIVYTSSYDRGLTHLLEIWPEVKKAVPQAELKVFYGWQLFDKFYANNPERQAWKAKMERLMTQDGITNGGRLTQGALEEEIKQAGIWAYPTDFYEISCISAIKAQAFGATPVVINYAALKETVQFGDKVMGDIWEPDTKREYAKAIIARLKEPMKSGSRKIMRKWASKEYNWANVISNWSAEFTS